MPGRLEADICLLNADATCNTLFGTKNGRIEPVFGPFPILYSPILITSARSRVPQRHRFFTGLLDEHFNINFQFPCDCLQSINCGIFFRSLSETDRLN